MLSTHSFEKGTNTEALAVYFHFFDQPSVETMLQKHCVRATKCTPRLAACRSSSVKIIITGLTLSVCGLWFTACFLGEDVSRTMLMVATVSVCGGEGVFNSSAMLLIETEQIWFRAAISQTFLTRPTAFNTPTWKPLHLRFRAEHQAGITTLWSH